MKPLGPTQLSVLESLRDHGKWHRRCGWVWDSPSNTARILDTLVARGLVRVETVSVFGTEVTQYTPIVTGDD